MSIVQLPSTRVDPTTPRAPSTDAAGSAGPLPEAPFAAILHDERTRSRDGESRAGGDPRDHRRADASSGSPRSRALHRQQRDAAERVADGPDTTNDANDGDDTTVARSAAIDDDTTVAAASPTPPTADPAALVEAVPVADPAIPDAMSALPATGSPVAATTAPVESVAAQRTAAAVIPATATAEIPASPATSGAPATVSVPASTTPNDLSIAAPATETSVPQAGSPDGGAAAPQGGKANPQSVATRPTPVLDGALAAKLPDATPAASTVAAPHLAKAMTSTAMAPATDAMPQPAAASAPTAASGAIVPATPQQLDGPAAATPTSPMRAVGLDRAVETVRLALRAAADRGVTHARINLSPRELGGIEIHLRHTADGLVARVVAEHAGAAHLLQHAGAELRRSLEAQGVTLLQLDIGASGEQGGSAAGEQRGFGEAGDRRDGSATSTAGDPSAGTTAEGSARPDQTLSLSNGVLVAVLA